MNSDAHVTINRIQEDTTIKIKYKKQKIPAAIREATWIQHCGRVFEHKCLTPWCLNKITVFEFQAGHNIPESKGGPTTVDNLVPICARCNLSMGDRFTFTQWAALRNPPSLIKRYFCCFISKQAPTSS
jgi:5-methylcytosine-specific restriction endonuclease McrA